MSIAWNFPNNNNGEINGIGNAGIETFKGSLFTSLAREMCQNSLDARNDNTKPVRIQFMLSSISREAVLGKDEIFGAIKLCKEQSKKEPKAKEFFTKALNVSEKSHIRVLRVSDFNTTGLLGSNKDNNSPWQDLVKSSGVSHKLGDSGGSFGIGKSAPYACSDLRTIFYNTLDSTGLKAYQGVAKLISFKYPDTSSLFGLKLKKGELTHGTGYYGETEGNLPVLNKSFSLDGFLRNEAGTDVYILGFMDNNSWEDEIIKSILENYLISIIQNDLEIEINDILINSKTLPSLIKKYEGDVPLAYNYYQVLTNAETKFFSENFENLGELELKLLFAKDFKRKVLMSRSNGMKIFDMQNLSGTLQFAGVCILRDKPLNEYFRKMENPQHTKWEADRHTNPLDAKIKIDAIKNFIKSKILELGRESTLDEMDAYGASEFAPDLTPDSGKDSEKTENISNEVKSYSDIEKSTNIKTKNNKTESEPDETGLLGESFEEGNYGVSDFGSIPPHGNDTSSGDDNLDGGEFDEGGLSNVQREIQVKPIEMRLFMSNRLSKIYKLLFIPEKSLDNAYIKIFLSGEQSNIKIDVKSAKNHEDALLQFSKNRIKLGLIEENKKYSIYFSINYNDECSMEVKIYGNKR